jgi:alkylhydroperoxidase/carboxymuconolactone decarboxylase family protein YurZ
MRVFPGFRELGKQVFADGAISRKHKELMALAVAVSQNCFD